MQNTVTQLALCLVLSSAPFSHAQEDEWTYLFEDARYDDFYFDFLEETDPKEVFEFTDERGLRINGKDHPIGFLQTLDEYSNYELEFEWRWPEDANQSGVLLHSSNFPYMEIWPESIEVDLEEDKVGDFWLHGAELEVTEDQMPTKAADRDRRLRLKVEKKKSYLDDNDADRSKAKTKGEEKKPGEWNRMRIVAKDEIVQVYLNDGLVNEGKEPSLTSGFLTFKSEESDIEFREVRLRELEE